MSSTHGNCSLYLYPKQPDFTVTDTATLASALREIGLISNKINSQEDEHHYFSGEKFLDYIAYMGCAPAIQFEASDDNETFCYIKIHRYDSAELIYSKTQARAPHCPLCKKPVHDWFHNMSDSTIRCDSCDTAYDTGDFNWRKMAGFARVFIEVTDIFPKEAIPQQILLDRLNAALKTEWSYFYACH